MARRTDVTNRQTTSRDRAVRFVETVAVTPRPVEEFAANAMSPAVIAQIYGYAVRESVATFDVTRRFLLAGEAVERRAR